MKILVISHMYPSRQEPVYGIFVHQQVKALIGLGCRVKVIVPVPYVPQFLAGMRPKWTGYARIPDEDTIEGVEVYYPRYPELPRSIFLEQSGNLMYSGIKGLAEKVYRQFKFEMIQAHVALPDGHCAVKLKQKYQVPVLVTVHGQDFQSTLKRNNRCRKRLAQVLSSADRVIAVSSKLKRMVEHEPYAAGITVINNGVDAGSIAVGMSGQAGCLERKVWPVGTTVILSVANLKKTKGIDLNLRALAALREKYSGLKYIIVGDGKERKNLESLAEDLGIRENVVFLGKLPHAGTMNWMAKADVFSLPSWQEGFGVVYLEAMLHGVPVIGVKGEGVEDVVSHGRNGLLVQPHDLEDLTRALDRLLGDPGSARKLGEAGRESVLKNFTWEQNARKTMELYTGVLETGSQSGGIKA